MISVDYSMLDSLLQSRGISRRQLAIQIGLSADSLSASFRRHSRMKIDSLWRIADCLSVPAKSLVDRSGYATDEAYQADLKAVTNGRSDHDVMVEDAQILEILHLMRNFNASGLREALHLLELLNDIPKYQKSAAEKQSDQWKTEDDFARRMLEAERAETDLELYEGYQEQRQAEIDAAAFMPED